MKTELQQFFTTNKYYAFFTSHERVPKVTGLLLNQWYVSRGQVKTWEKILTLSIHHLSLTPLSQS